METVKRVVHSIIAYFSPTFPSREKEEEYEHIPTIAANREPPEFALTPPETDETLWYDNFKIVPAESLPDGWAWTQYGDGSGSLKSPDSKSYFGYDLGTHEFQHPAQVGNNWCFFDGYPYNCISFAEFKKQAEQWIVENTLTEQAIKAQFEDTQNQ